MSVISVTGYVPSNLNHCPECGAEYFPHTREEAEAALARKIHE